jgi:UDP-N-acetyl-D-glucosamine/UDP-N-acetyl-D-galactosamine dehydrogenase
MARRRETAPGFSLRNCRIGVIGLGYVGLPLAVEFGKQYETSGFDVNPDRIAELRRGKDRTLEVKPGELKTAKRLRFTTELRDLGACRVFIVTVPTPIDADKRPDLRPLERASESVGKVLKRGDIVIYESTVYPGCTEEICVPILERQSGLKFNRDFYAGYSPERINPGDRQHRLPTIRKVTAGSTPDAAAFVDKLYSSIITAGTHPTSSIRVAEAAKVIENTQRDVNIALVNELAMIFNRLDIDTEEVLEAAGSKWNFLPFRPGLVGGHCIGVDPYYLTHKAQQIGYHPEMILAGRRINDNMALYVAGEVVRLMTAKRIHVKSSRILVLGLTFKENTPDLRNSKVADVVAELRENGARVDVWDPWVSAKEAHEEYGIKLVKRPARGAYDAIVLAVGHRQFKAMKPADFRRLARRKHVIYDIKYLLARDQSDGRL